ncbi:sodium/potassium-transporting ATPase subunit alpha [Acrasis kona]|uniref:Sodium/potassium-transporting ATPase subunit alpha n=1 Tax=Acrasis kona TaxID=1008807 RepID=A0AAW2ZA80_9EUKA
MSQYNIRDVSNGDHNNVRQSIEMAQSYTHVPLPDIPRSSFDRVNTDSERKNSGLQQEFVLRRSSLNIAREDMKRSSQDLRTGVVIKEPNFDQYETPISPRTPKVQIVQKVTEGDAEIQKDLAIDYHKIDLKEMSRRYETDTESGLLEDFAKRRLTENGPNEISTKSRWTIVIKILGYIFGGFGFVLWPSAILAILSYQPLGSLQGSTPDPSNLGLGIILFIVIFTNAFFDAWQDFQSMKVMNSIGGMLPSMAMVIRSGKKEETPIRDLVLGDLVEVKIGEKVPADLRVVKQQQLKVDNSILTGETDPISCTVNMTDENFMETKNLLFMGTSITEGVGQGVVVAVGNQTVMGKITKSTQKKGKMTPINKEILGFITFAVILALCLSVACLIAYLVWLRVSYPGYLSIAAIVITILTSVVAFIPEGLPISVSLTFTLMARRMFLQNVLVKHLPTVETLGSIDMIASDKTGTLTQNKMSVMNVLNGMKVYSFEQFQKTFESNDAVAFKELVRVCGLCNRATFDDKTAHLPMLQRKVQGDASDTGILLFAERFGSVHAVRDQYTELCVIPFNSKNKWMLNIVTPKVNSKNASTLLMKGAAEIIIERCTSVMMQDGSIVPMTDEIKQDLIREQEHFSGEGQRVLGCCKQDLDPSQYPVDRYVFNAEEVNFPLEGHCFVGLVALIDPPREDVPSAIERCNSAGIRVMMVTGDHHVTAAAIARMVGIIKQDPSNTIDIKDSNTITEEMVLDKESISHRALTIRGPVVPTLDKTAWDRILMHQEICWARTTPDHKLRIVKECQARKHIVAVTGDGVNDAPALKQANVGVAMGAGSEVAREAAAIVLMDSRFSSIVAGIENGRIAFENLKKVLLYLLPAGSFSEIMPIILNIFFGIPIALSSFLMIMICVATDIMPSLSLISEKAEADLMTREPRSVTGEKLVNPQLFLQAYFFTGIFEAVSSFIMYFYYMSVYAGIPGTSLLFAFNNYQDGFYGLTQDQLNYHLYVAQTIYFVNLVIVQFGNLLSTRTRRLSFFQHLPFRRNSRNLFLFVAMLVSIVLALLLVHIPFFNNVFNTRPIPVQFWFIPIGWALLYFSLDEVRKCIARLFPYKYARRVFW